MSDAVETLIFVDVDGVLNVGLRTHEGGPALLLNQANVRWAMGAGRDAALTGRRREAAARLAAAADRFGDLVCPDHKEFSSVLVRRLALILKAARGKRSVVLTSTWREPESAERLGLLREEIAGQMGGSFDFDARTEVLPEATACDRLRSIGRHVAQRCAAHGAPPRLSVVILDDFFVGALDGWDVDGRRMRSAGDVEAYVRRAAGTAVEVRVRLLHCYTEWADAGGLRIQAAVGLTRQHIEEAREFLAGVDGAGGGRRSGAAAAPVAVKLGRRPSLGGLGLAASVVCCLGLSSLARCFGLAI